MSRGSVAALAFVAALGVAVYSIDNERSLAITVIGLVAGLFAFLKFAARK